MKRTVFQMMTSAARTCSIADQFGNMLFLHMQEPVMGGRISIGSLILRRFQVRLRPSWFDQTIYGVKLVRLVKGSNSVRANNFC
jgi:hypothetical protein